MPVDSSRDVSMDESGADADDEKINVQSEKKESPKSPILRKPTPKSPVLAKSPTPSPSKKTIKKCDKVDITPTKKSKAVCLLENSNGITFEICFGFVISEYE